MMDLLLYFIINSKQCNAGAGIIDLKFFFVLTFTIMNKISVIRMVLNSLIDFQYYFGLILFMKIVVGSLLMLEIVRNFLLF